jgi:hypothetical protein
MLLWTFLAGTGGYYFVFRFEQFLNYKNIEKEIIKTKTKLSCQVLSFRKGNESGIKWLKKDKEFIFNSQMYDIIKIKLSGKNIIYYCFADSKEKTLIADLEKKNRRANNSNQLVRKIIQYQFLLPVPLFSVYRQSVVFSFFQPVNNYSPPVNIAFSPPPEFDLAG